MKNLEWKSEKRKISELIPAPYNPRELTEKQAQDLTISLDKFSLADPIVINQDNTIIGGHQRVNILKAKYGNNGFEVDVRVPSRKLIPEEEKELNLRLNKNLGQWDFDALANFDEELLKDVGFESTELDKIFQLDTKPEDDDVPEVKTTDIKPGDIFQLGEHRLLCGDCTIKENVDRLMQGDRADIVFTDPPYGVEIVNIHKKVGYGNGRLGFKSPEKLGTVGADGIVPVNQYRPIVGDETTQTAQKTYELCCEMGIDKFILWGGNYFTDFLPPSSCWLIWDKRGDLPSNNFADCEIAWTNLKKPSRIFTQKWSGLLRQGDRKTELTKRVHPTQKPVGIHIEALKYSTLENEIIIDLFGGSGSTLIACEKLNRKCRMMEIDPIYVQTIIDRWEAFTNLKAEKINA